MSFNLNISEGTCYFSSGNEAPSRFIPCGNSQGGHVPCCESQDNCLSSNACYNPQYGVTYLAGCTDSSYDDPACPNKGDYSGRSSFLRRLSILTSRRSNLGRPRLLQWHLE